VFTKANVQLEAVGIAPISERVSPHSLRRTYASLRYACGDDPVYDWTAMAAKLTPTKAEALP
jgi:integrase